jgi:DNA-directed RNA polymerase specialized sigma24 family protein
MSPVFSIDLGESDGETHRSSLWVSPVDPDGNRVDPQFIDAAYAKAEDLLRYRAHDLRDDALRQELIEKAVHRASRAKKRDPVRDYAAYLFSVFARLADAEVGREKRFVAVDADCLENLAARRQERRLPVEEDIQQRQVLDAMEERTRWAWSRRLSGYEVQEIAAELNISADCLSTRMRRGLKAAAARLLRDRSE